MKKVLFVAAMAVSGLMAGEASAQVRGSFQATCKGIVLRGPILQAYCATPGGQLVPSQIDIRQCGGGGIGNAGGQLICEGGRARRGRDDYYEERPRRRGYEDEYRRPRRGYEEEYEPRRRRGYEDEYRRF